MVSGSRVRTGLWSPRLTEDLEGRSHHQRFGSRLLWFPPPSLSLSQHDRKKSASPLLYMHPQEKVDEKPSPVRGEKGIIRLNQEFGFWSCLCRKQVLIVDLI